MRLHGRTLDDMTHEHDFDKSYWERHWADHASMGIAPAHPYLAAEVGDLPPGTALDAGCGAGAEAIWLATAGWQVTAVDISAAALARGSARASGTTGIAWVEADLSAWTPPASYDLVTTHYAHPAIPQLDFYERVAGWVAPGGTLLVVGHLHTHHGHHPDEATATAAGITARLDAERWEVVTAVETERSMPGREEPLHDVVVRARRRSA